MDSEESITVAVVVSLTISTFLGLVSLSNSCSEQKICLDQKTCVALDSRTCNFQNTVSPAGYKLFNTTGGVKSLSDLERGVCAPGERQNLIDGRVVCLRQRVYPSALNHEIMNPSATSDHKKACGAWIDAGAALESTLWSFFDEKTLAYDVSTALNARLKIRGGVNLPSKFRAACTRMIVTQSEGAAGTLAFEYLKGQLPIVFDSSSALSAVGTLVGHYCDAPVALGLTFGTSRSVGLAVNVTDGLAMTASQADEWLYAADVDRTTRSEASQFIEYMLSTTPGDVSMSQVFHVYRGATVGTAAESTTSYPHLYKANSLPTLSRFIQAHAALGNEKTRSYLIGAAARCSFAVRSVVTGEFGAPTKLHRNRADVFSSSAAGLGRLKSQRGSVDRLNTISPELALNASTVTWSKLRRDTQLISSSRDQAVDACNGALVAAFPDDVDQLAFDMLVPDGLYTRLGTIVEEIRPVVATVLTGPIFGPTLSDAAGAASIASNTIVRVAGAPFGTWGGRDVNIPLAPAATFTSSDGALVMLLKQARSLFANRMALVQNNRNGVCDLPPLFSSLTRNAYMLPSFGCSMFLPGILVAPFASELYDQESLQSRIGWVVAHEIAHSTAAVNWNRDQMDQLLVGYQISSQSEAVADLAAAAAIITRYPGIGRDTFCQHLSQLWCARQPQGLTLLHRLLRIINTHPPPNERGDLICAFLRNHFSL